MEFECISCPDRTGRDPHGLLCQIQAVLAAARQATGGAPCTAADVAEGRFVEVYMPMLGDFCEQVTGPYAGLPLALCPHTLALRPTH